MCFSQIINSIDVFVSVSYTDQYPFFIFKEKEIFENRRDEIKWLYLLKLY